MGYADDELGGAGTSLAEHLLEETTYSITDRMVHLEAHIICQNSHHVFCYGFCVREGWPKFIERYIH